ncbi:MAG: RimK family alpha-L-glutamate ligase [Clostridia bacterium]|nr:RimK family alpha-L-glutamate ligase [Clostridia bacterium]
MDYLIYNGFWNRQPPATVQALARAAKQRGIRLSVTPHTEWTAVYDGGVHVVGPAGVCPGAGDTVLFWDKDVRLAHALEAAGARVHNSARAIALCDDKAATHRVLAQHGVPMPETLVAPMAYTDVTEPVRTFLDRSQERLGYPMVVKECFGSLGGQVYLARDRAQLEQLAFSMGPKPFLTQRFLAESAGQDWRLYVTGDAVAAAMHRTHPSDFRANLANGGKAETFTPTEKEKELALRCCRLLGLTFGAVDLLRSAEKGILVCEVNSNAFTEGISRCTGIDVADAVIRQVFATKNV